MSPARRPASRTDGTAAGEGPCGGPVAREHGQPAPARSQLRCGKRRVQGARRHPARRRCRPRASADRPGPPLRGRGPGRRRADRSRRAAPVPRCAPPVRPSRPRTPTHRRRPGRPTTASTAPSPPPPSAACASAATSQGSASGSEITCSAPTATACFHASGGGSPRDRHDDASPAAAARLPRTARAAAASSTTSGAPGQLRRASWGRGRARPRIRPPRPSAARRRANRGRPPSPARAVSSCARLPRRRRRLLVVPSSAHCGPLAVRPVRAARQAWGRAGRPDRRVDPLWMEGVGCGQLGGSGDDPPWLSVGAARWRSRACGPARSVPFAEPLRRTGTGCAVRGRRSARGGRTGRPPSGGIDGGRRRFSSGGLS